MKRRNHPNLCRIKSCPLYFEARLSAHVVNVEFEVATVHNGQHQTKSILGFVGVCQTYLKRGKNRMKRDSLPPTTRTAKRARDVRQNVS